MFPLVTVSPKYECGGRWMDARTQGQICQKLSWCLRFTLARFYRSKKNRVHEVWNFEAYTRIIDCPAGVCFGCAMVSAVEQWSGRKLAAFMLLLCLCFVVFFVIGGSGKFLASRNTSCCLFVALQRLCICRTKANVCSPAVIPSMSV